MGRLLLSQDGKMHTYSDLDMLVVKFSNLKAPFMYVHADFHVGYRQESHSSRLDHSPEPSGNRCYGDTAMYRWCRDRCHSNAAPSGWGNTICHRGLVVLNFLTLMTIKKQLPIENLGHAPSTKNVLSSVKKSHSKHYLIIETPIPSSARSRT